MIDTVILMLNANMYQIINPDAFRPSARWILGSFGCGIQSKQNSTKKELRSGIYKPRLTISSRPNLAGKKEIILKIELSLPKLFFGNNFEELRYKDFKQLTQNLACVLESMGVLASTETLAHAPVLAIHYAKNIALTDGSIPYHYINKIKESNIKLSLDVNQTDYRNDGHCYKWHCNSYEVVFYDKIKDLEMAKKSDKRSLEKDNALQLGFILPLDRRKKFEILRMEVRLNKRQKMKQLFKSLNIKSDLTFKKLFKPAISKKVLLHYLDVLEARRAPLLDYKFSNDKALLTHLTFNNLSLTPKQILQCYGLKKALEVMNIRELRMIFARHNEKAWYRLMAEMKQVTLSENKSSFRTIREHTTAFKTIRLSKLKPDY